jgi:hypothetical protein
MLRPARFPSIRNDSLNGLNVLRTSGQPKRKLIVNDKRKSLMAGRRFGPDVDRELWTMILPAGGDRLEHEL